MNVKKAFFTLLALLCLHLGWSQQMVDNICMQVIGSNGLNAQQPGKRYDATLGEVMTVTYTSADGSMTLTQGFHQPECASVMVPTHDLIDEWQVKIYPNPASAWLHLQYVHTGMNDLQVRTWNAAGALVSDWQTSPPHSVIDCSQYASGLYFLEIQDPETGRKTTIRFVKTTN